GWPELPVRLGRPGGREVLTRFICESVERPACKPAFLLHVREARPAEASAEIFARGRNQIPTPGIVRCWLLEHEHACICVGADFFHGRPAVLRPNYPEIRTADAGSLRSRFRAGAGLSVRK